MNKVWQISNNDWYLRDISGSVTTLENTIYTMEFNPKTGEPYLSKLDKKFEFDFKLYGLKSDLISRAVKYYRNSKGNLGVLLNGVKGTGKTITAKILANELDIPIILVTYKTPGLTSLLAQIETDLVILIDEYDKIFTDSSTKYNSITDEEETKEDSTLLGIMDGVFNSPYRRTFILTTNELWLNDNMINRPGRIRYKETFEDLEMTTIEEILDDILIHKTRREEILTFIKSLKLITVDILKAIITEVNIFDEEPEVCCKSMNLEFMGIVYAIYEVKGDENYLLEKDLSKRSYENFMANGKRNHRMAVLSIDGNNWRCSAKILNDEDPITIEEMYPEGKKAEVKKIVILEDTPTHKSFKNISLVF